MFHDAPQVLRAVENGFGGRRVLVVGDLMLDAYVHGDVSRISPEAPVPVVRLRRRTAAPGGAGNVLLNLVGFGLQAAAVGVAGDDPAGTRLGALLADAGVDTQGIILSHQHATTTKTRVVSGQHQLIRLDEESPEPPDATLATALIAAARPELDRGAAAVVLSDYAKGVCSAEVCREIISICRERGLPTLVDPKGRDFAKYAGASALTPNLREFEAAAGVEAGLGPAFQDAARRMREALDLGLLVVTCGDRGIACFGEDAYTHHPAVAREVFDVSGAGDTVLAALAAGIVAGLAADDAVRLANLAAGIVVGKVGTAPVRRAELLDAVRGAPAVGPSARVVDDHELLRRAAEWRARGERIVFTNGCFDLLHVGHVTLLARARAEGDRLVVGLNTDRSVRALKGPGRPVVSESDRAHVLAGLASVDAVVLFDDDTPLQLIQALRPDVLVKGGDYTPDAVVGANLLPAWNGRLALIPLVDGRSTTRLVERTRGA